MKYNCLVVVIPVSWCSGALVFSNPIVSMICAALAVGLFWAYTKLDIAEAVGWSAKYKRLSDDLDETLKKYQYLEAQVESLQRHFR